MLHDDEIDLVARVVATRAMLRQDQLDQSVVAAAYAKLLKVPEAECESDIDPRVEELDRGEAVIVYDPATASCNIVPVRGPWAPGHEGD